MSDYKKNLVVQLMKYMQLSIWHLVRGIDKTSEYYLYSAIAHHGSITSDARPKKCQLNLDLHS